MFKSAQFKLTALFVVAVMIISTFLSVNWYNAATTELNKALERQQSFVGNRDARGRAFVRSQGGLIEQSIDAIKANILVSNAIILLLSSVASYYLARRVLQPIERSHGAQRQFISDASHELRTPLTALTTEMEVTLSDSDSTKDELREVLSSSLEEVRALTKLTDNLMMMASEEELLTASSSRFDVSKLIESVVSKLEPQAKLKSVKVATRVPHKKVVSDEAKIKELLTILVDNAIKYSFAGGEVLIKSKVSRSKLIVSVEDHGIGIEDTEKIFTRFYREDESRSGMNVQGFGLGLSIAKHIDEVCQTNLRVSSEMGKGSIFMFDLDMTKD